MQVSLGMEREQGVHTTFFFILFPRFLIFFFLVYWHLIVQRAETLYAALYKNDCHYYYYYFIIVIIIIIPRGAPLEIWSFKCLQVGFLTVGKLMKAFVVCHTAGTSHASHLGDCCPSAYSSRVLYIKKRHVCKSRSETD